MNVPWFIYAAFVAFVIAMLLVDLLLFHRDEQEPTLRKSALWAVVWIGMAIVFGFGVWALEGGVRAGEYFAGFLIEKALSVDNMFVFVVIFSYFGIPPKYQHNVLFYGILGAFIFRGIFIALGYQLISNFHWVIYVFGAFLLYTAYRIGRGAAEHVHPENNPVLKFAKKRLRTTSNFDGQKLFTVENGKRVATPLFITLLFVETTDIVFAVDSIPAIFAITREPFIVLTSNIFAILGLRALYFLLAGALNRLHLLNYGLAVVLGFVGVKMLLEAVHVDIPIWISLTFITVVLTLTTILSLKIPPKEKKVAEPDGVEEFPKEGAGAGFSGDGSASGKVGDAEASASDERAPEVTRDQ